MSLFTSIDKPMGKLALLIVALIAIFTFSFSNQLIVMAQERAPGSLVDRVKDCENPEIAVCVAGNADQFNTGNGTEVSTPGQDMLDLAAANGWTVLSQFDTIPTDKFFMHTFGGSDVDSCLSGNCRITGAKLIITLKAGPSSLAWNDTIHFLEDGVNIWSDRIHDWVADGNWQPGDVETITFDLDNLLPNGAGVTSVLNALQDGDFDLYIEDDTGVDYIKLIVERCCDDCVDPPANMVAWWTLDETSGTTSADIAMFPNNGSHVSSPTPVSGMVDGALHFNGSNYVEVPSHNEINFDKGDFSIDAWVKTTDKQGVKVIVDKRYENRSTYTQGYSLYTYRGQLGFQLADGNGSWFCSSNPITSSCTNYISGAFIADGEWHLVAVTVDRDSSTGGRFYVDGSLVNTFNPMIRDGSLDNEKPLRIASRSSSVTGLFQGEIDEVELFNRVLTDAEIESIYEAGSAGKCKVQIDKVPHPSRK